MNAGLATVFLNPRSKPELDDLSELGNRCSFDYCFDIRLIGGSWAENFLLNTGIEKLQTLKKRLQDSTLYRIPEINESNKDILMTRFAVEKNPYFTFIGKFTIRKFCRRGNF